MMMETLLVLYICGYHVAGVVIHNETRGNDPTRAEFALN